MVEAEGADESVKSGGQVLVLVDEHSAISRDERPPDERMALHQVNRGRNEPIEVDQAPFPEQILVGAIEPADHLISLRPLFIAGELPVAVQGRPEQTVAWVS